MAQAQRDNQKQVAENDGVIVVKNLSRKFGDGVVLDDISLAIEKGKTTVIIGPSGCGKTVLIKHLIVLLRPTLGEVYFKNRRIDNLPESELNKVERVVIGSILKGNYSVCSS